MTVNGFPFNSQIKLFENHLAQMRDLRPDALIVASPGTVRLAKKIAPDIPLHLSTQANVLNTLDAEAYYDMGVKRIIAAREMSLKDLEAIKTALPDLELEIFVHGSMCFAYSGRCLVSSLQTGRVANRGSCANDCRFPYRVYVENEESGVLMRVDETEEGTYLFNAKDLNMIAHLEEIAKSGVIDSLKIEGRTKSAYYVAAVTRAYRMALSDLAAGTFDPARYEAELMTTKHRGFTDGYLVKRPYEKESDQKLDSSQSEGSHQVVAQVDAGGESFHALGRVDPGEPLEIVAPPEALLEPAANELGGVSEENGRFFVSLLRVETVSGKVLSAVHSGNLNAIKLPTKLPQYTFLRKPI
ncbi:MAG: peptidase U32 family protein [Campylobacterales bacterium]